MYDSEPCYYKDLIKEGFDKFAIPLKMVYGNSTSKDITNNITQISFAIKTEEFY